MPERYSLKTPFKWFRLFHQIEQARLRLSGTTTTVVRAPAAQRQMRQMRKKISFGPTFFHLAQTFGAYFFRRHFYFFLCYKRYELRKRLMTPNKQCRWRVFLNWW